MAVSGNQYEVVNLLLENGADVSATDTNGNTMAFYLMQSYNAKSPEAFEANAVPKNTWSKLLIFI